MTVSEEKIVTLFVGTNVFIQMKDIQDLPWTNLFPNLKELRVLVCSRIIEELDDFKSGQSKRKRNRSRAALKNIKLAARSPNREISLRDNPLKIILKLNDPKELVWASYPRLDASRPDDHLVLEALTHGQGAIVFSHDTGPYVQALAHGINAAEPEDEGWLLPHEPTTEEQKVRRLERELEQVKATNPQVDISSDCGDELSDNVTLYIPILPPLENDLVERLTSAYVQLNPPHDIFIQPYNSILGMSAFGDQLTHSDKDEYLKKYDKFKSDTRTFFKNLHKEVERVSLAQPISYKVENVSQVAAKGLRVDANIDEPFYLLADEQDADETVGRLSFPTPPNKPVARMYRGMESLHRHATLYNHNKSRDPVKFYWEIRPEYGSIKSAIQCEDFRAAEVYNDNLWICALNSDDVEGKLTLKISASKIFLALFC